MNYLYKSFKVSVEIKTAWVFWDTLSSVFCDICLSCSPMWSPGAVVLLEWT